MKVQILPGRCALVLWFHPLDVLTNDIPVCACIERIRVSHAFCYLADWRRSPPRYGQLAISFQASGTLLWWS
ncbi:hypothetical protein GGR17_003274 [Confluentimicrobium naphthalenivorans]|uniref:Uncharacterized protein n=1 Tax=Actibacterium naphthalenivorans TaxID=1614693 RepID=A0A840CDM9_9RHOB|nr:hypothetical protein [Actibacterium naphthalenivorans]